MTHLSSFWSAASRLSGRVDFSVLGRADPSSWSADRLRAIGLSHSLALSSDTALETPHEVLTLASPRYPARMASTPFAPPVLFCEGNLALLERPGVAIVGARRCTAAGVAMARELAGAVASVGGVVVSGMAYGIDTAAHLAAPGSTIAVLGQGLDVPFSASRARIRETILSRGGLLISELLPDVSASKKTFPLRNRVIAWLSRATVVVEATERSGSLHTARAALAGGLDVLAVPGHPRVPTAAGCLALIDQGAEMVRGGGELLAKLQLPVPDRQTDPLLEALAASATFDELLQRTGQTAPVLIRQLAMMELTGRVERLPGDRYALSGASR